MLPNAVWDSDRDRGGHANCTHPPKNHFKQNYWAVVAGKRHHSHMTLANLGA